jgi:hypothetical protein
MPGTSKRFRSSNQSAALATELKKAKRLESAEQEAKIARLEAEIGALKAKVAVQNIEILAHKGTGIYLLVLSHSVT